MYGWVTLTATPKSHPFEERRIRVGPESELIKIGRAVAKSQASHENAVFDCKVLSRNHAVMWFKDGDFWIRDTKSSNGTFVNNEKLNDADTRKVITGDIIQLGVEIVENTNKVAYGCIYAVIQCFSSDGKLIDLHTGSGDETRSGTLVSNRKLFQMQQYISEAIYREKMRDEKIAELMSIIEANEHAAETAWKALVNEDRLLARIEALEAQLDVTSNNNNPDKQKEDLLCMIDEKTKFEAMTKELIRRLQEEVGETSSRLKDMERSLDTTESTCNQLRSKNADLDNILAETTEMYDVKVGELDLAIMTAQEAQKAFVACDEKLQDVLQKNMKLSKNSVINESATGLSRLLANALNSGSSIENPNLDLLIDALRNAEYLPINDVSSASDSELKTEIERLDAGKSAEAYLKEILELQARNRVLESELSKSEQNVTRLEQREAISPPKMLNIESSESSSSNKENLEISPSSNVSFVPMDMVKKTDQYEQLMFLISMTPLLALILSLFAPIHRRFFGDAEQVKMVVPPPKIEENNKKKKQK